MKLFPAPLLIFIFQFALGQKEPADITMISEYGSNNPELTGILQFQNIDYFRVKFIAKDLKGKHFMLYCKEMWDGELKKVDTLINSKTNKMIGKIKTDTLSLTVFGARADDKLKLFFKFPMVGLSRKYDAIQSDDYSLRDIGADMAIAYNKAFPAFAYILPYEENGWKMYCAVDQSGTKVEDWGKQFKIRHYLIFEMKFGH